MTLTQINKAGLDELALDHVFTIGASGTDHYTFQGEGLNGTVNDPTLYLTRGKTYRFENGTGGHPIRIQSTSGASGTAYNTGVTNNAGSGTVIVEVQHDAPDVLYYQCTSHANMNGVLYITGALADGGVTTAKLAADAVNGTKIADNAVAAEHIAANAVGSSELADNAVDTAAIVNQAVNASKIADGTITDSKLAGSTITGASIATTTITRGKMANNSVGNTEIMDEAVTLNKLEHGTSSNDGKFLRANNGADPSFETVTSTNIIGNADNRVITGSGTANTLTAQSNVVVDANGNLCTGTTSAGAKLHSKGDQSGGLLKCDAAEGTTRFFVTGNDSSACEVNLYDGAGAQKGILVAESNGMSIKSGGTPSQLQFFTTRSGSTSARRVLIDEYGATQFERGSNGWSTVYHKTNNGGTRFHYRQVYTSASSTTINLIRIRRHYWGGGHYKIKVRQTYYGGSAESHFWIHGHAANGAANSFSINHNNVNVGNSNWIQKTATSFSSPGNNYSGWIDVFAAVGAYEYYDIIVEASGMPEYSQDINSLGNDAYALHPVP